MFVGGLILNDYSQEDEENHRSYQNAAPQYNFETPDRLVIPGKGITNFLPRFRNKVRRVARSQYSNYRLKGIGNVKPVRESRVGYNCISF